MTTITPTYKTVKDLLQSQSFAIDEYQREYKWEQENFEELLSDLRDKFLSSYHPEHETARVSSYEDYFLGSIIVSKRNGKKYLIDGQQRVTSLTLLLIYLYHTATSRKLTVAETIAPLIYADSYGRKKYNLDISERLPLIDALFNNQPFSPDGKDESVRMMYARYNELQAADLAGELDQAGEGQSALPHFIYWLIGKVGLIEIETDNDNYAYAIFETMNDRGKPLSPVDMLKAYLLAPIEDDEQRRKANETWRQEVLGITTWNNEYEAERDANFIKAWLRAQYAESIRERRAGASDRDWELIGSNFHRWVRDNAERLGLGSTIPNLRLINAAFPFFAAAYRQILAATRRYTPGLEAIYYNGHNDFTWQKTVLLAPLVLTDSADTVRRKLAATATYLDIWIMRRVVNYTRVSYSSTSYTMYLLCLEIRGKPLPELVTILTKRLVEDEVTFAGYPARARKGINDLGLNQFSKRYIFHLLARLTAFVEHESGRPDRFPDYVNRHRKNSEDIEHIWPNDFERHARLFSDANEFQDWRNNVASLLLLPADINRSLQNMLYEDKVSHYAGQNLYAASLSAWMYHHQPQFKAFRERTGLPFKAYATFGKEQQLERRALVQQLAEQVWSPDRLRGVLL